jgi:hypothetical protein
MSFYTLLDWFKQLRLSVNESKTRCRSQGVACHCHEVIFFK